MRRQTWIGIAFFALLAGGRPCGGEPPCSEPPGREPRPACSPWRIGPTGGWFPYGGGLLRWWPRDCFPRCGGPDDYCRKPLPHVCWPPYPPYYIWGPPQNGSSPGSCRPGTAEPH
jgi:hypothetical protein